VGIHAGCHLRLEISVPYNSAATFPSQYFSFQTIDVTDAIVIALALEPSCRHLSV
jgi:hypothetical protein